MSIASICVLLICGGALCLILGARRWGYKLVLGGILLAVLWPFVSAAVRELLGDVHVHWSIALIVVATLVISGIISFTNRKRKLKHWLVEKPTSLKKRVERD